MKIFVLLLMLGVQILLPFNTYAQIDPGQDPFTLTPEKLRMFQGFEAADDSMQSLFQGDGMKDNGLFGPTSQQLGGAAPPPVALTGSTPPPPPTTDPDANNGQQGNFVMIRSQYEPHQLLTSETAIAVTVTVRNVSDHPINDITFTARLKDENADLLNDPDPQPGLSQGPDLDETIDQPLVWPAFDLDAQEEAVFRWSIQAHEDDSILRWTFTAEFGAGQSILLLWMPIQNPNPVGNAPPTTPGGAISTTCSSTGQAPMYPTGTAQQAIAGIEQEFGIQMVSRELSWTSAENEPFLRVFWDALAGVSCSSFLENVTKSGPLQLVASTNPSFWGYQPSANEVQFNLINMRNQGALDVPGYQLAQLIIHELGHVFQSKNPSVFSSYNSTVCGQGSPTPYISGYGSYGVANNGNCNEDFAEMIGYYAFRQAHEWGIGAEYCASKNPYDRGQLVYYSFAKASVFGNITFGPDPPASPQPC